MSHPVFENEVLRRGERRITAKWRAILAILAILVAMASFDPHRPAHAAALPADSNVLDVRNFGAKGDGQTDDTRAIQAAIDQLPPFDVKHPWQTKIIYFASGVYVISDTLQRKDKAGHYLPGLVMLGEAKDSTVIKLAERAPGYQDRSHAKSMILMASGLLGGDPRGGGKDPAKGEGNDAYVNTLESITLEVGRGNDGAVALDYLASNIGAVRDVTIRAVDRGRVGLSMVRRWIGPALIERVSVTGFDVGIDIANTEYSVTLEDVTIEKSREVGLRNASNSVAFHNLKVIADGGIGIANLGQQALLTGIDGKVSGRGQAALINAGSANLLRVDSAGFSVPDSPSVEALDGVFEKGTKTKEARWTLPVASKPVLDEAPPQQWTNVTSFGATPNGSSDFDQSDQRCAPLRRKDRLLPDGAISGQRSSRGAGLCRED